MDKKNIDNRIINLIVSSLTNNISDSERKLLENWINQSNENSIKYNEFLKTWNLIGNIDDTDKIDIKKEWQLFKTKAGLKNKKISLNYLKVAASIVIIFSLSLIYYFLINNNTKQITISTASNSIIKKFSDGSQICLNVNSSVIFPEKFEDKTRTIKLKGQAFFNIMHDRTKPFIIEAGNVYIEDIGTSFFVSVNEQNVTEVIVKTGKVAVYEKNNTNTKTIIEPNEHLTFTPINNNFIKTKEPNENYIAWQTHILKFDNTNLLEVIKCLENAYHKKIKVSKQLYNCKLTAIFNNQSLHDVLEVIKESINIEIKNNNDFIELSGKGCM